MKPEHEPQQPSIRENIEQELQQEIMRKEKQFEGENVIETLSGKAEGPAAKKELLEKETLIFYLNNFPRKLPDSHGNVRKTGFEVAGKTPEEFAQDVLKAIKESGVDEQALREYVDRLNTAGLLDVGELKAHRELVLPVFIKLLEMGYGKSDLGR